MQLDGGSDVAGELQLSLLDEEDPVLVIGEHPAIVERRSATPAPMVGANQPDRRADEAHAPRATMPRSTEA